MTAPSPCEPIRARGIRLVRPLDRARPQASGSTRAASEAASNLGAETIVAVSTAIGAGAIGIVRASGPRAVELAVALFHRPGGARLDAGASHRMWYGHVREPGSGRLLDEALLVIMRAPATYTREDVVEVHCHGGPAAQREVLRAFVRRGARLAEPGEFTRRAYLNGRIDLAQAESVAAIVRAQSAGALRAAVHQLSGGLSERLVEIRRKLVGILAVLEAGMDFSDEDVDETDPATLVEGLDECRQQMADLLKTAFLGRVLDEGVRTAIIGKPNVGKSSLLNALLMRERAIVSELPGTTRDTVEELIEIGGVPLRLVDTAGLRQGADPVERLGIERSKQAMEAADLVLAVFDGTRPLDEEDEVVLAGLGADHAILVANKCDLTDRPVVGPFMEAVHHARPDVAAWSVCSVSALTGTGIDVLRALVEARVVGEDGLQLDQPFLANERQRTLVQQAADAADRSRVALLAGLAEELVCEDVREAVEALGRVTGEELVPDLLDEVFSRFCIGK
jgi:tRNA modification GTPase